MNSQLYEAQISTPMGLTPTSYPLLEHIAKWTKFLTVVAFIILALSLILLLSAGILITGMNRYAIETNDMFYVPGTFSWGHAIGMIIMVIVYSIPVYFLYQFSVNLKKSLDTNDTNRLTNSISFLHKHYKYIGILTIVMLVLYLIWMLLLVVGAFRPF